MHDTFDDNFRGGIFRISIRHDSLHHEMCIGLVRIKWQITSRNKCPSDSNRLEYFCIAATANNFPTQLTLRHSASP